jgi:hypothetical protein
MPQFYFLAIIFLFYIIFVAITNNRKNSKISDAWNNCGWIQFWFVTLKLTENKVNYMLEQFSIVFDKSTRVYFKDEFY